ncbi:Gfo/Idh/MocA family protein [Agrobacterium rosae]
MNSIIKLDDVRRATKPARLGFLGVGWIGRSRMEAMLATGLVTAEAIADPCAQTMEAALAAAPAAEGVSTLDELLDRDLDGIVIATPSAQHADQSIRALHAGVAVFCQKPLGRDAAEARAVVDAARTANVLLGVDLSYRHTKGIQRIKELLDARALGDVMAVDLTFHNAYGPDKPWFYDREHSGGGCLIDLGVHLIDLALWALDFPEIISVSSHLMAQGKPLSDLSGPVEDFVVATLQLENGAIVRIACSWRLNAGTDCVIDATFYGRDGGAAMRNINGSFYDFTTEKFSGTSKETLVMPPDDWGARAAVAWAKQLSLGSRFDPASENLVTVSKTIDQIYRSSKV